VTKALNWLHRNQIKTGKKAGTWPTTSGSGGPMAGFGLLTFLAHGELPTSKKYGSTVQLAIDYLLRTQKENGQWEEKGGHEYGHAIATYAVSEAFAMTKHPSLKYAMEKGIGRIIDGTILERFPRRESMQPVSPYDTSGNKVTGAFWNYDYADGAWPGGYEANYMNGDTPMQPKYSSGVQRQRQPARRRRLLPPAPRRPELARSQTLDRSPVQVRLRPERQPHLLPRLLQGQRQLLGQRHQQGAPTAPGRTPRSVKPTPTTSSTRPASAPCR